MHCLIILDDIVINLIEFFWNSQNLMKIQDFFSSPTGPRGQWCRGSGIPEHPGIWEHPGIGAPTGHPTHNIRVYWNNYWRPIVHVKQIFFEKSLIEVEVCSPHLYASFGMFCVQIGSLVAVQRVFKHSEEFRNRRHFPTMTAICEFSNILQRLTVRVSDNGSIWMQNVPKKA